MSTPGNPSNTETRSAVQIAWSCIAIIFACSWTAIHPNVPPARVSSKSSRMIRRRLRMTLWTLLVPELMVGWAVCQWVDVRNIMRAHSAKTDGRAERPLSVDESNHLPQELQEWTKVHSYFLAMGGFATPVDANQWRPLRLSDLTRRNGHIPWPEIQESQLVDRSKGGALGKTLVIVQMSWFTSQLIARAIQGLAVTELEIMTLAYVLICGFLYFFWFHKPYDVQQPVVMNGNMDLDVWRSYGNNPEALHWRDFLEGSWLFIIHGRIVEDTRFSDFLVKVVVKTAVAEVVNAALASMLSAVIFGGTHLIAWNFDFPTEIEHTLWILSSLCVTVAPLIWSISIILTHDADSPLFLHRIPTVPHFRSFRTPA